jgi:hypothetical protein
VTRRHDAQDAHDSATIATADRLGLFERRRLGRGADAIRAAPHPTRGQSARFPTLSAWLPVLLTAPRQDADASREDDEG